MANELNAENNMIIFPDIDGITQEVKKLKIEISMLILERDELLFVECKNIETAYMIHLGFLEYKIFEKECLYLRLKRRMELIQAKLNRQEKVDLPLIDEQLDQEFIIYKHQLDEQLNKLNNAIDYQKGEALSEEDYKALKKMYRTIVKSLHPDLNNDLTEEQLKLFQNAVSAYEKCDILTIEMIYFIINGTSNDKKLDNRSVLDGRDKLCQKLELIKLEIEQIKASYPYTMKSIITDQDAIEKKKTELEQVLIQLDEVIKIFEQKIDALRGV